MDGPNPAESAKPPTTIRQPIPATSPDDVAKVIAEARSRSAALGLYLWLVVVTGVRRGELCGLQIRDIDLDRGLVHVAFNYVVRGGQRIRKDTKTHQDRRLAIDPDTCALIATYLDEIRAELAAVGVELQDDACLFSNDPAHARPWNPDWATHKVAEAADAAGVRLDIKGGRHYTASQLLAGGFDLRNTSARLGHSGGGATTLRHYADPVPEVDRRAVLVARELGEGLSCGITLQPNGRPLAVASSDANAAQTDELQYGLDHGPCLTALRTGQQIRILASRAVIDQAIGVIMAQRGAPPPTPSPSWAASQNRNVKLRQVAEQIITGIIGRPPQPPTFNP